MRKLVEIQRFRENTFAMIFLSLSLGIPITVVLAKIFPLNLLGEEWIALSLSLAMMLGAFVFLLNLKSEIHLKPDSILYRRNMLSRNMSTISKEEVKSYQISRQKQIHGNFKLPMNAGQNYVLKPGSVLVVQLKDGRRYRFGINRAGLVKRFLHQNWKENQ